MRFFYLAFFINCTLSSFTAAAQKGRLSGKIIDAATGNPLAGATVTIEPGNKNIVTDLNGQYSFNNLPAGNYRVTASNISYTAKTESIAVSSGDASLLNIVLQSSSTKLSDVTVKSVKVNRESASALLIQQKNRSSVSDGISFEVIRKTPDRSAGDVLKRVTGASLQEDKFAIIRGLNDRYNYGMLNGAPLPSSESDRKAFAFDIFPANLLDNIIIAKTATPDMPGEFGGGIIMVNTKSGADKDFQSLSLGGGYNTITTGKDRIDYKGSRWGFLEDGEDFQGKFPNSKLFREAGKERGLEYAKKFANNWGLNNGTFSPNYSAQYSIGHNFHDEQGKDFISVLLSGTYSRTYSRFDLNRTNWSEDPNNPDSPSYKIDVFDNTIYSSRLLAGLLGNVAVKLNRNHTLSLKTIYNIISDDRLIEKHVVKDIPGGGTQINQNTRVFMGNKFFSAQLEGQHYLPSPKLRINWSGFNSSINRTNPARNDSYDFNGSSKTFLAEIGTDANENAAGTMRKLDVKETINGAQIDLTKNFNLPAKWRIELKAGALYQKRSRDYETRIFGFAPYDQFDTDNQYNIYNNIAHLPIDSLFAPANMSKLGFKAIERTKPFDKYSGNTQITAWYGMLDQRLFQFIRMIYGVRVEDFKMELNSLNLDFSDLKYRLAERSVLPSANMVISLNSKQNLRLCYSQTVNRPEFREISPSLFFDYNLNYTVSGDTMLKMAKLDNYDVRYEFYPGKSQVLSVTGFYKKFHNPIEQVFVPDQANPAVVFVNSPDAKNIGVEAEVRVLLGELLKKEKGILNNITALANYAYINSKVKVPLTKDSIEERSLQGQSAYVMNAGLMFNDDKNGFSISAFVNRTGPRIFIGSSNIFPAVWENGRTVLDLQVGKTVFRQKMEIRAGIKDLFAQQQYFFEDVNHNNKFDKEKDNITQSTTFGKVISLNVAYKF